MIHTHQTAPRNFVGIWQQELTIEDDDRIWPLDHLRIDLKAVG